MQQLLSALNAHGGADWGAALGEVLRLTGAKAGRIVVQGREAATTGDAPALRAFRLTSGGRRTGLLELDPAADPGVASQCAELLGLAAASQGLGWSFEQFRKGAAHDIRGSLARASNLVQMLAKRLPDDEEAGKLAAFAVQQLSEGEQLLRDLSAFCQAATQHTRVSVLTLQGVIETLVYTQRRRVEAAGGRLVVPERTDAQVWANEDGLVDALERVVSNSLLYAGESPVIALTARNDGPRVVLDVTDSGPQFEAGYAERVFEPFYRLHGKKYPGNGLGLSTVRKLVEGMGGEVKARPADPTGFAVEFTLQRAA